MSEPSPEADSVLFFSPEPPYPLAGGGQMRSASLLHYWADRRPVDLITFRVEGQGDPAAELPPRLVSATSVVPLPRHAKTRAARAWRNSLRLLRGRTPLLDRFTGDDSVARVRAALAGRRYELAVIEHFWCAPYLDLIQRHAERVVLDLHNVESVLHASCARSEARLERLAHRIFSRHSARAERELLPRFDLVLAASELDAERVRALAPGARVAVFPNSIPLRERPQAREEAEMLVFSGNLEYHPNISAIKHFRREIWPRLRRERPRLVWRLVGRNEAAWRRMSEEDPRIELSGTIPDAVEELAKATLVVVPVLAGSGTRVKIMEAWAAARAVISTAVGAEGLPVRDGENLVLADSADEWIKQVIELLEQPSRRRSIGECGRRTYEQHCNWPEAWRMLDEIWAPARSAAARR